MGGYKNQQGRKASAGTIARRLRENGLGEEGDGVAPDDEPPAKFPNPPTFMSTVAKAEWQRIGKRLLAEGLFNPTLDLTAQNLCHVSARMRSCGHPLAHTV